MGNIILPNDGNIHALGGGILHPYGVSDYSGLSDIAGQFQNDVNAITHPVMHPDWAATDMLEQLPLSPAQVTQNKVRQAQISRMKETAKATPVYGSGAITQPTPNQSYMGMLQKAHDEQLNSKQRWNIQPPEDKDITEGMWIGSALVSLFVGATTGNIGQAMAAGGLAALNIHDQGYARQERDRECQRLLDQGYSYDAVYQWYTSGDNKTLMKDREMMEKRREFDATNALNRDRLDQQIDYQNGQLINQNINAQANAGRAGYDVVMPGMTMPGDDSVDGIANMIKSLEGGQEHVMNSSGASGVYQQKQSFWNQYKPANATANVNDATEVQQREAAINFIQQMKAKGYSPEQILAAYNQGEGALQNALKQGGLAHWQNYLKPEGQNYVNNARKRWATLSYNGHPTGIRGGARGFGSDSNQGGFVTLPDGSQKPVEINKDGSRKIIKQGSTAYYQGLDGTLIPVDSVASTSSPVQNAANNLLSDNISILRSLPENKVNDITGYTGGLGDMPIGADTETNVLGGDARKAFKAASQINGAMLTGGVSNAKAMGASGINTKQEADMYFAAMPQPDFSSYNALMESLDAIVKYTNDFNASHGTSIGNGRVATVVNNNTVSDSDRSALGY